MFKILLSHQPTHSVSLSTSPSDLTGVASSSSLDLSFQRLVQDADIGVDDFDQMGLPSYKPTYLFLVRVPLNVVHECLRLRLEQKSEMEPSLLSVRQVSQYNCIKHLHESSH